MDLEPRTQAPAHATGAVEFVPLAEIDADVTFQVREEGDVSALAASLGRLGQLVPIELRVRSGLPAGVPRYQVVSGFRRIAALRLLRRERALARIHAEFSDEDAWGLALSQALLTEPLDRATVEALRARIGPTGVAPWALDLIDDAMVRAPVEPALRERFYEFLGTSEAAEGAGTDPLAPSLSEGEPAPDDAAAEESSGSGEEPREGAQAEGAEVEMTPEELATDLARRMYEVNADLAVAVEAWAELPPEGRDAIREQARWISELLPSLEQEPEE